MSQDAEIAKTFNEYFINVPILDMPNNKSFSTQTRSLEENTISGIIERYKYHPSINLIKSRNSRLANTFCFTPICNQISWPKESCTRKRYSYQYFKTKIGFFCIPCAERCQCLHFYFKFPNYLKEADVIPV